jgi:hypothetical protein
MKLYAFAMTPGSGKTYNSKFSNYFIDVDQAIRYYNGGDMTQYRELFDNYRLASYKLQEWYPLKKYKVRALNKYIKDHHKDAEILIIFTHSKSEAIAVGAEVLGDFKVKKEEMEELKEKTKSKTMEHAWYSAKSAEILTQKEIHNRVIDEATRLHLITD